MQQQARLWIFDHARPKRNDTSERFPEIFTPDASGAFKLDSRNSLRASWSYTEMNGALGSNIGVPVRHRLARLLPLYQVHWLGAEQGGDDKVMCHFPEDLPTEAEKDAKALAKLFGRVPGW